MPWFQRKPIQLDAHEIEHSLERPEIASLQGWRTPTIDPQPAAAAA